MRFYPTPVLILACSALVVPVLAEDRPSSFQNVNPITNVTEGIPKRVTQPVKKLRKPSNLPVKKIKSELNQLNETVDQIISPVLDIDGKTAFFETIDKDGWRAIEREWVLLLDDAAYEQVKKSSLEVIEATDNPLLNKKMVRIKVSKALDSRDAIRRILPSISDSSIDRNHLYSPQQSKKKSTPVPTDNEVMSFQTEDFQSKNFQTEGSQSKKLQNNSHSESTQPLSSKANHFGCSKAMDIGMIDTGVNVHHKAFEKSRIESKSFLSHPIKTSLTHGSAIAGLLVGEGDDLKPLLPNANLIVASVFYEREDLSQGASVLDIAQGLQWLITKKVPVINMSLTGPPNHILEAVVNEAVKSGALIFAAAGNEGPNAPPMYPAAYQNVVAITAIDDQDNIYRWANRGDYVDFSASGVAVSTVRSGGGFSKQSGTSLATPFVSAVAACHIEKHASFSAMKRFLESKAIDLGSKGHDDVYGYGKLSVH